MVKEGSHVNVPDFGMGSAVIADFELVAFCSRGFNFVWARKPSNLSNCTVTLFNDYMMQTSGQ